MNVKEHSSALAMATNNLNLLDTKENEFVSKLTAQLADKDSQIRKLTKQVEDFSRQRLARLTNATETKGGSAGPNMKTELARTKKQLREKEKEITKLRTENAQANLKNTNEEEQEKKVKQLQSQVSSYLKKSNELKVELKKRDEKND